MKRRVKHLLISIAKRYTWTRTLRHYYVIIRNRVLWLRQSVQKVEHGTIIFQAYNGVYACSPKAIYEKMLHDERFSEHAFIWVVTDKKKYPELAARPRTSLVEFRSREYYRAFAHAKYWIVNSMLPLRIVKRKGQVMVQCWHGTPLKRLRNDIIENTKNAMNSRQDFIRKNLIDSRRYDYFLSPSDFATEKFITAFGFSQKEAARKIIQVGYPRNDSLKNCTEANKLQARRDLGLPQNKKLLLYAPTWRDDQHTSGVGYTHANELDFDSLQKHLGNNYAVLFRAHYMIASNFDFDKYQGFVYNVSDVDDVNDLYIASDALITDYSSVMFDFANLQRPMLFYMYDLDHYENHLRGFYIDLADLPGEIIITQAHLEKRLLELESYQERYAHAYEAFMRRFTYLDDGRAADRLIDSVFDPPPPLTDTRPYPIGLKPIPNHSNKSGINV